MRATHNCPTSLLQLNPGFFRISSLIKINGQTHTKLFNFVCIWRAIKFYRGDWGKWEFTEHWLGRAAPSTLCCTKPPTSKPSWPSAQYSEGTGSFRAVLQTHESIAPLRPSVLGSGTSTLIHRSKIGNIINRHLPPHHPLSLLCHPLWSGLMRAVAKP